jgi:uncharacterized repeat protein (TIGR01451 family)
VLVVALGFTIAIAAIVGGLALTSSVNAATYTTATNGPVNWTGGGAWTCSPVGPGAPTCPPGSYPGGQGIAGDLANLLNTPQLTVNTAIPAAVTLNTNNGTGASVTVASGGSLGLTGSSAVTGTSGLNTLTIQGGTLTNSGTLTVGAGVSGGNLDFVSGTLNGAGTTTIASNGVFNITGTAGSMTIDQQTVNNGGTANFTSGNSLTLSNSAAITNAGTFNANGTGPINAGAGTVLFSNPGIMQKSSGGAFNLAAPFTNTSTATLAGSALEMDFTGGSGPSGQSNATWNLGTSGVMKFGGTQVFNNAQTFPAATGTVFFEGPTTINTTPSTMTLGSGLNLTNNGTLDFGTTTHSISLAGGNFVQAGGATVQFKLGPTNGVSDALTINGSATFAGTLVAVLATGYTPADGDTFTVITDTSQVGTFSYTPLAYANGHFQIVYNATNVQLIAQPEADISLLKTGPASVLNGQNATFTIKVGNLGPSAASSIVVSDSFTNATFVSASVPGGSCVGTGPVNCTIPSLASGSNVFITIVVKASSAGTIMNTATRTSSTPADPNSANDSSTFNVTVNPAADLNIGVSGPATAPAGSPVNFTATISNPTGPDAANNPTVNFSLTNGMITGASGGGFSCSNTPTTATCTDLSPLGVGGSGTITISTTAPNQAGTMTLTGNVSSTTGDPNSANNTGSASVTITALSDLSITKVAAAPPVAGQNVTYNIVVTNNGPSDASSVSVTDTPGAGLTFVSNSGACATNFPCTFATLAAGSSVTINSTFSVASSATGTISNTASVSSSTTDPAPGNNSSTAMDAVSTSADLAITKALSSSLVAGQNATYTISVTNNGPSDAANVTVTDPTPAQTTFVSNSGACTSAFPCNLGTMTPGQTLTITSIYNVNPSATGIISNTATVSSTTSDPNAANNTATSSAAVGSSADLSITKTASSPFVAGQNATYTIAVTNSGPSDATAVTVSDTLPAPLTFVSNSGACTTAFPCSLGTVASGSTMTITTTVQVASSASGPVNNTASVSSSTSDPVSPNNSSTATTTITTSADVSITKALSSSLVAGTNATYTITVTNNGPSDAGNVTVNDATPAQTTFVSNSGACSTPFPCSLGTMTPGQVLTITSTYAVSPSATGNISNTATVSSTTPDPTPANNTATSSAALGSTSDLAITKSGPAAATPGQTITYTVMVTNSGPSDANSVTVSDPTPAGLTFVSNSGACTTPYPCAIGALAAGSSATITSTYTVNAGASGSITNTASVSGSSFDPNTSNNSASATTTLTPAADLLINKTGPSTLPPSGSVTFTITVKNLGPSSATGVIVNDTPVRLIFVSNSGGCTTPFPCNLGTLAPLQIVTITSTFNVVPNSTSATNTATVSSSTPDSNSSNNSSSVTLINSCPTGAPSITSPTPGQTDVPVAGTIQWIGNGSTRYDVNLGPAAAGGCSNFVATVIGTSYDYSGLSPNTDYEVSVVGTKPGCPAIASQCVRFRTAGSPCNLTTPVLLSPANGSTVTSPVTFSWSGNGETYHLVAALNGVNVLDVTTDATSFTANIGDGKVTWSVTANAKSCPQGVPSAIGSFNVCSPPSPPHAGVVGAPSSGRQYSVVVVDPQTNAVYEFQEADNEAFNNPLTQTSSTPSVSYVHSTTSNALVFFYRVRALSSCTNTPGPYSKTVRVVIVPITVNLRSPSVNVPAGSKDLVVQQVFIPGESAPVAFTATADRPWIVKIDPSSGILPTAGITLNVTVDPAQLPNGTFTATVIVNFPSLSTNGRIAPNGTTSKQAPITINLVTPVVPNDRNAPTADSLIIPAVGRLIGLNSQWRSDVRIFNASPQKLKYLLNFVPQGSSDVKQTTIETEVGATTALDDVIHNWYGFGEVGDSATGVLEVRPLPPDSGPASALTTILSSRTYSLSGDGTLGQFIPAVPFKNFVGTGSRLSMQQIAQSSSYRTNFAVIEASGSPVSVLLSMFNSAGTKLFDLPVNLAGGEQKLLNGLLSQQGVSLTDGRMEVSVTGGDGKVTAYASVVDNLNADPLFVPGKLLGTQSARSYVVPGVADLNNGAANWRTDMRIFNSGSVAQAVSLTFYEANNAAAPRVTTVTVNPNEVKVLDSVLASVFSATNVGGAVHADTAVDSQLVITARTYNLTSSGTLGQFIPAATLAEGIDRAGRALNILQVEDSTRYRTNVGLAEMSGKPSTVEISVSLPDSKVTPIIQVPLGANEFRQFGLAEFGLGNVYNARVSVKVVDGDGRVTAYGSVIDQVTTAPTYVAPQ